MIQSEVFFIPINLLNVQTPENVLKQLPSYSRFSANQQFVEQNTPAATAIAIVFCSTELVPYREPRKNTLQYNGTKGDAAAVRA